MSGEEGTGRRTFKDFDRYVLSLDLVVCLDVQPVLLPEVS